MQAKFREENPKRFDFSLDSHICERIEARFGMLGLCGGVQKKVGGFLELFLKWHNIRGGIVRNLIVRSLIFLI